MKRLFLLYVLTIFFSFHLRGQDVFYQTLGSKEGLSQSSAVSIWQDRIGKIWIGNDALNSFDGENVSVFKMSECLEGVEDSYIHALCGNDSTLFFLAERQLICFDLLMETFYMPDIQTQAICYSEGSLYYVSNNTFCQYNPATDSSEKIVSLPSHAQSFQSIIEVGDNHFWVATSVGVFVINRKEKRVEENYLPDEKIINLYKDSKGYVWIVSQSRRIYLSSPDKELTPLKINQQYSDKVFDNHIYCIQEDILGAIWVGTITGVYQLIRQENEKDFVLKNHLLEESTIYTLYSDRQGSLWIGSYYGDVRYFNPDMDNYMYYVADDNHPDRLHGAIIGKIAEDKDGTLYFATEGSGINILKKGSDKFTHLNTSNGLTQNKIRNLWYDEEYERLFVSLYMEGACYLDIRTGHIHPIEKGAISTVYQQIIEDFVPYGDFLLLRTQDGIFKLNRNSLKISKFFEKEHLDQLCSGIIRAIHIDDREILWVSSYQNGLFTIDLKTNKLVTNYGDGVNQKEIIPSAILSIAGDTKRGLYFVTLKSGILKYDESQDTFYAFNEEKRNLVSNICYNIAFSPFGNLLLTSSKGVSLLQISPDNTSAKILYHIGIRPSSPLIALIGDGGLYVSRFEDMIYIGSLYGMLCFSEKNLPTEQNFYSVYFRSLQINNEPVLPTSPLLKGGLHQVQKLDLPYNKNTLSINFASSNYLSSRTAGYEYKLEGLDEYWTETNHKTIIYNSLRPGNYKLVVRELANPAKKAELAIVVKPPLWATIPAVIVYMLIFGFILWRIISFSKSKTMLKASLELERRELARIEETNRNKMDFFVNISNEFRTPLTLIISQLDRLPHDIPLTVKNKIDKVKKQAAHLQELVVEMLDFRKMEQNKFSLKISNRDIATFLQGIFTTFTDYAQEKQLNYRFNHSGEEVLLWFDQRQMQKVFYNLLSFFFRNASPKDSITLSLHKATGNIKIQITHKGVLTPQKESKVLLDMLNNADTSFDIASLPDGAIGLAFSVGVVRLHKGKITVSNEDGKTRLIISLPTGASHINMADITEESTTPATTSLIPLALEEITDSDSFWEENLQNPDKKTLRMVLVEEEYEMSVLLRETFSMIYDVIVFPDAESAYDYVIAEQPDIILSEINLPGLSGIEFCSMVKSNVNTYQIPVILLTSYPSEQQNVETIRSGADYYFVKPFNIRILFLRCNYLVKSRHKLIYDKTSEPSSDMLEMATNEKEQTFLKAVNQVVEENLYNPNFDTTIWYEKLGIGRTRFFNEIKEITGMTPNDYLLHLKMEKGSQLLREDNSLTIAEIAYQLGFSTPAYFTKCFKKQFGITPQEFKRK